MVKITDVKEYTYQEYKKYCKCTITIGINKYLYVTFFGDKEELLKITTKETLFNNYKFYAKLSTYKNKNYVNYVLSTPKKENK